MAKKHSQTKPEVGPAAPAPPLGPVAGALRSGPKWTTHSFGEGLPSWPALIVDDAGTLTVFTAGGPRVAKPK